MGRKRKPTHLKIIHGTLRRDRLTQNEPQPVGDLTTPTAGLTPAQLDIWHYAIEHAPHGLLRKLDESALRIWTVAYSLHSEANENITKFGMVVKAPNTGFPVQSPWLAILNRQSVIMLRAAAELGFTPATRSRISIPPELVPNPWDNF